MAPDHYQCQLIIPHDIKSKKISDTVEFRRQNITTPVVTPEDRILHGLTMITNSLMYSPTAQLYAQIQSIKSLHDASASWASLDETPTPTITIPLPDQIKPVNL